MKWLQFILSHSIFIAFCAAALSWQTILLLQLSADIFLYGFVFFATICSYNFYWLLSKYYFNKSTVIMSSFLSREAVQVLVFVISGAGAAFCFFRSSLTTGIIVPAIFLTILYAFPLLPYHFLKGTRNTGILKTILLAFTWSYVTAFMPLQKSVYVLSNAEVFIITRRFLFMLMLCIIFDSRDMVVDKINGLRSLATELRPSILRYLIIIIFIILFATNFLSLYFGIHIRQAIALQASTLALLVTYFFSLKKQGYLFYYFFVDGLMLFSALATYIASI